MDIGIDPTVTASSSTAPQTARRWSVEDVARLQDLLGRTPGTAAKRVAVPPVGADASQRPDAQSAAVVQTYRQVSGSYLGGTTIQLELRVDVDGLRPLRCVSGDFVRSSGGTLAYVGSFVVNSPLIEVTQQQVTLEGTGEFSMQTAAPRVRVVIPRVPEFMPGAAATVQFASADGVTGASYACEWRSAFFRRVEYERDFVESVEPFAQYDVGSLPSGGAARVLTVERAFAEAGVEMVDTGHGGGVPGAGAGADAIWTNAELHASMENHFSAWRNEAGWKVWLLAATSHEIGSSLRGIMFDQSGRQRQGCAVFHSVVGGTQSEVVRAMLRTYVHELGHCFNLYHSHHKEYMTPPQPNRLDALSWMHYPAYYQSANGNGEAAYWAAFPFQFDDLELAHLRHGFRNAVVMGGDDFGIGAAEVDPRLLQSPLEDRSGYTLEIRGPRTLVIGTPVVIELKLSATDKRGKLANAHIHPSLGYVQVGIARPGGKTVLYRPLLQSCAHPEPAMLNDENPAEYDSAYIGYGRDGFYFDAPGRYEVRAIYHAHDGSKVFSNVLRIWIRDPMNEEEAHIADLYMGDEQGQLLSLLGSDSDTLSRGNAALTEVRDRYPKHPMSIYAQMVQGVNAARAFKTVRVSDRRVTVRKPEVAMGEALLASVVARSTQPPDPTADTSEAEFTPRVGVDNITLSMVMDELARVQLAKGDPERAQATLLKRTELSKERGVPRHVLRQLRDQARATLRETRASSDDSNAAPTPGTAERGDRG